MTTERTGFTLTVDPPYPWGGSSWLCAGSRPCCVDSRALFVCLLQAFTSAGTVLWSQQGRRAGKGEAPFRSWPTAIPSQLRPSPGQRDTKDHEQFFAQGAPRDPHRDSRGERSPWLPLETRPDSPGEPGQCGRPGFDPWVGKIPWRRQRLPTPVFWAGEFHGLYVLYSCLENPRDGGA